MADFSRLFIDESFASMLFSLSFELKTRCDPAPNAAAALVVMIRRGDDVFVFVVLKRDCIEDDLPPKLFNVLDVAIFLRLLFFRLFDDSSTSMVVISES